MFKFVIQRLLNAVGLSLHRKGTVGRLLQEVELLKCASETQTTAPASDLQNVTPGVENVLAEENSALSEECRRLRKELENHENRQIFYAVTEDYGAHRKTEQCVDRVTNFGEADFADLSCWLFASSLINHRIVHQRVDEGSLLWRAVKASGGPVLEVGRAAGGSTLILLGASGSRPVISIDRAPFHAPIAEHVFGRPDVSKRLKLYRQTSREPIAEHEFGMIFIDADHSYEGICHDIATFWNQLQSFDGKPPLAAFHDAADNPITYVEPVKHACEELLAEPGAARVFESWGSMLVLEKTGNIDPACWYVKEHFAFWEQYATAEYPVLKPSVLDGRLHLDRPTLRLAPINLLGDENVEDESWLKRGVRIEKAQLNEDNPLRLLVETSDMGEHGVKKTVPLNSSNFQFSVFLRPHHVKGARVSVLDDRCTPLAYVDFELSNASRIGKSFANECMKITNASFCYRNGYFRCDLAVEAVTPIAFAGFAVNAMDPTGDSTMYRGNEERGLFINLSSVRQVL